MKIKAVFFDLDDTLHDSQSPFVRTMQKVFPDGYHSFSIDAMFKKFRFFSDHLWKVYSQHKLTLAELRKERIIQTLKYFDVPISKEEAIKFQNQYEIELNSIQMFSEVPTLFNNLKKMGLELGIITNGPVQHQQHKMNILGVPQFIANENIFISDEVGIAKPDSKIFHHAADSINIPINNLLYIGDSWENDVVSSIQAGWQTIWYNHRCRKPLTEHKPLAEIMRLASVLDYLNSS